MAQYLVSVRTGRKFKIVEFDKATNKITLQGDLGKFEETYDKDRFKKLGYKLQTFADEPADEETSDAE